MNFTPALVFGDDPLILKGELDGPTLLELNDPNLQAGQPVFAELAVTRDGENFLVQGWVRTELTLLCGRCAGWMPWPIRSEFVHLFEAPHPASIDLTPLIREDILLELPLNAACQLGVDGRCPVTGEVYRPRPQTSPSLAGETVWQALDKLKTKDE